MPGLSELVGWLTLSTVAVALSTAAQHGPLSSALAVMAVLFSLMGARSCGRLIKRLRDGDIDPML